MSMRAVVGNCGQMKVSPSRIVIPAPRHILSNCMVAITLAIVTDSFEFFTTFLFSNFGRCFIPGSGKIK